MTERQLSESAPVFAAWRRHLLKHKDFMRHFDTLRKPIQGMISLRLWLDPGCYGMLTGIPVKLAAELEQKSADLEKVIDSLKSIDEQ